MTIPFDADELNAALRGNLRAASLTLLAAPELEALGAPAGVAPHSYDHDFATGWCRCGRPDRNEIHNATDREEDVNRA